MRAQGEELKVKARREGGRGRNLAPIDTVGRAPDVVQRAVIGLAAVCSRGEIEGAVQVLHTKGPACAEGRRSSLLPPDDAICRGPNVAQRGGGCSIPGGDPQPVAEDEQSKIPAGCECSARCLLRPVNAVGARPDVVLYGTALCTPYQPKTGLEHGEREFASRPE